MEGLIVALITPFLENGDLDVESFKRLIHFQIEQGTKSLLIGGSTGEAPTLSSDELDLLIFTAVKEARGRISIIAGVGTYNTKATIEKTIQAKKLGADSCLVVFPYYNRPVFEGCLAHFKAIASIELPIIVYYHPGRTGLTLSTHQLAELCSLPGILALKDCSGNVKQALEVMKLCKKTLFSGDDSLTLPFMEGGAHGLISVLGNLFPYEWNLIINAALNKDMEKARSLYKTMEPLCKVMELETNPQCIKYAMSLMGHCSSVFRLPLLSPQRRVRERIEEELRLLHALTSV